MKKVVDDARDCRRRWSCWLAAPAMAQDYRGRVQGRSRTRAQRRAARRHRHAARTTATGVSSIGVHRRRRALPVRLRRSGQLHRDRRELQGFQIGRADRMCACRSAATSPVDLQLGVATVAETHHRAGSSPAGAVQLEQLGSHARAPAGRPGADQRAAIPYSLAQPRSVDRQRDARQPTRTVPTITPTPTTTTPAAARRRANDVLLDGVALGASYKTAYTPSMDAVGRNHRLEEQRRRRERQQPRRHHQPEHEVGHQQRRAARPISIRAIRA